jgi:shikimate dehydrogenase
VPLASRYAVFGQPIAHSLSPRIHAMFGAQLGIDIDYRAIEASYDDFAASLVQFAEDGGRGANVTLPLKQEALAVCGGVSERARRCASVNTLIREGDMWRGDSTDGVGWLRDLRTRCAFDPAGRSCLLIGAGGAARAIAFALADAGAKSLSITNRTFARGDVLAQAVDTLVRSNTIAWDELDSAGSFDLVINATAAGHARVALDLPDTLVSPATLAYDLSYGEAAGAFLLWASTRGARACDGLGMLVEQAAESFAIWHGAKPDTAPVYDALRALTAARDGD